jgi:hypothetical protein
MKSRGWREDVRVRLCRFQANSKKKSIRSDRLSARRMAPMIMSACSRPPPKYIREPKTFPGKEGKCGAPERLSNLLSNPSPQNVKGSNIKTSSSPAFFAGKNHYCFSDCLDRAAVLAYAPRFYYHFHSLEALRGRKLRYVPQGLFQKAIFWPNGKMAHLLDHYRVCHRHGPFWI